MGATDVRRTGCVVSAAPAYGGKQGLDYSPGVSAETVDSRALWLGSVELPPGGRTNAHIHERHESAFYMVSGDTVEVWTGDRLERREVMRPGDYLYIPPGLAHVAANRSETAAFFVGARTDPNEQESVVLRPELDKLIP